MQTDMADLLIYLLALLIPSMKMILRADQNHCRDVAPLHLYIRIYTSI